MVPRSRIIVYALLPVVGFVFGYMFATQWGLVNRGARNGHSQSLMEILHDGDPSNLQTSEEELDKNIYSGDLYPAKKYFLDCGANVASSVLLFRETYPGAKDFIIHSFEIDEKLQPYFAPFSSDGRLVEHIPEGVAGQNGNSTVHLEGAWYPGKVNNQKDMQWGGGTLFTFPGEIESTDGGMRKLSRHVTVPLVDLSQWIQQNTRKADYVILKLDVEGAEYDILKKMLAEKTFEWIDKFYGEFHDWSPTGYSQTERADIRQQLKSQCVHQITWAGETKTYGDFEEMHNTTSTAYTPGPLGTVIDKCKTKTEETRVALVIQVGMNVKKARRLVETIKAYPVPVPLTLFVYGDFVEQNPSLVKQWSEHFDTGIRSDSPVPHQYWELQNTGLLRMSIVSAEVRLSELNIKSSYIYPNGLNPDVVKVVSSRNMRIIASTLTFPPEQQNDTRLTSESYFKYRDVERTPKALKIIDEALDGKGGILSLDSDFPDNYMISVFLLDYLLDTSSHRLVSLRDCIAD